MTVGVFGGTFNPPHCGHLIVAESVRDTLRLDSVLFIPAAQSPHKGVQSLAPARDRLEMTRLAVAGNSGFEVSDLEMQRGGTSYTVDTLREVALLRPGSKLKLLIGADNLFDFGGWKSPADILELADLVVLTRPGFDPPPQRSGLLERASVVTVPQVGISGTDVRRRVKFNKSIRYMVPAPVEEYIRRHALYR